MVGYIDGKSKEISLSKIFSGESNSVTPKMVHAWKKTSRPTLLSKYDLKDTYNNDTEFGLFCKCMINKTCQLKSEKCSGGKLSKVRITGMITANAVGDKYHCDWKNPKAMLL